MSACILGVQQSTTTHKSSPFITSSSFKFYNTDFLARKPAEQTNLESLNDFLERKWSLWSTDVRRRRQLEHSLHVWLLYNITHMHKVNSPSSSASPEHMAYEQRTLYGALVVTLTMLLCLLNCRHDTIVISVFRKRLKTHLNSLQLFFPESPQYCLCSDCVIFDI